MSNTADLLKKFSPRRIVLPILIGLSVATFLLLRNFDKSAFQNIQFSKTAIWALILAILMVIVRDIAYMYRIRLLTDNHLSWRKSFDVIMLWEFASAITPSIVGGTAFALFILNREKIPAGKSTTIVLLTAFLDELFFIIMAPIFIIFVGKQQVFLKLSSAVQESVTLGEGLVNFFLIGYIMLLLYTVLLAYGLFINPNGLKVLIERIFSIKFLKKWKEKAFEAATDVVIASNELKDKPSMFWVKALGSTIFSWTARYLVVNFLIIAFPNTGFTIDFFHHVVIYARQIVMWVIMLIPITPGGSGIAEVVFNNFFNEFIGDKLGPSLALFWRLISYYPYLFIGAFILPRWIRRTAK